MASLSKQPIKSIPLDLNKGLARIGAGKGNVKQKWEVKWHELRCRRAFLAQLPCGECIKAVTASASVAIQEHCFHHFSSNLLGWYGREIQTGGKLRARLCGIRAQTNRNMAASGPIQPSKLRANWCNVSARLFLECLDFWKWRVVCLGCFVHLCSPLFLPSYLLMIGINMYWLVLKSHWYLDIQLDRLVLCGLHGSIGSLWAIGRQHHAHAS